MGLIKALLGAAGGTLADQWKEFFYCEAMDKDVLVTKGQKQIGSRLKVRRLQRRNNGENHHSPRNGHSTMATAMERSRRTAERSNSPFVQRN